MKATRFAICGSSVLWDVLNTTEKNIDNLPFSATMRVLDQFGVGGQMFVSYRCGHPHYANLNAYRRICPAAFAQHRETNSSDKYARSLPVMAKAIVSLTRRGRMWLCRGTKQMAETAVLHWAQRIEELRDAS